MENFYRNHVLTTVWNDALEVTQVLTKVGRGEITMSLYRTGRVCVKTMGREAGCLCVIVEQMEGNYVVVTGPKNLSGVRRKRCNTRHLEPLETILRITSGADDAAVEKAIESAGLTEKFRKRVRFQT